MSSPHDEDEDFRFAIALSLGNTQVSQSQVIDLVSDDDEDDDDELRQAIALSLQESEKVDSNGGPSTQHSNIEPAESPFKYGSAREMNRNLTQTQTEVTPSSTPTQAAASAPKSTTNSFGFDRKAMEQERLARLEKRKRSPSPERPSKMTTKQPSANPRETASKSSKSSEKPALPLQFPNGCIKRTWAYKHARTNDIKIEEVLQADTLNIAVISAFNWDDDWVYEKLPWDRMKQIWVMSCKGELLRDKWRKDSEAAGNVHRRICFPPLDGQAQNMHSKLMLLFHATHLRVVIPTANMIKFDWGETNKDAQGKCWQPAVMENTVFIIDLPRRSDGETGSKNSLSWFGKDLLEFLEAQQIGKNVTDGLLKFDFSATDKLVFVHSIPEHMTDRFAGRTGFAGLSQAVRRLGLDNVDRLELEYISSSLGALKESTLQQLYRAARGDRSLLNEKLPEDTLNNIRVYFPTNEAVVQSTGGSDCGGIITLNKNYYFNNDFPRQCLRQHISNRPGLLSHNKLILARGRKKDGKPFAWVYVGSANLTESAWGSQKILKSGKEGKVSIRNWECGVVVPVPKSSFDGIAVDEGEVPPLSVFKEVIEVPIEHPGEHFGNKQPWFFRA